MSPPKRSAATTEALRSSLVDHARALVEREGAAALTMRALATEAGCAVGLPYKVFADRRDLVAEICLVEFGRLAGALDEAVGRAGTGPVGSNLTWIAELLLDSPAVVLAEEIFSDHDLGQEVSARIHQSGVGPASFEAIFAGYLVAEKATGRVDGAVDQDAIAFLVAGAVHNLVVSGAAWPHPDRRRLRRHLDALAAVLAPKA